MRAIIIIAIIAITAKAYASIELKAPETCVVGELVILDASESTCESLKWQVLRVDSALSESIDFRAFDKIACFSARESSIWLIIVSGVIEGKPELLTRKLTVIGNDNITNDLDSKIKVWLKLVKSNTVKEESLKLAQSFRTISNASIPPEKFLEATALANKQILGDSLQLWIPFFDELGRYLDSLDNLVSTVDYQKLWVEIANGLERAIK